MQRNRKILKYQKKYLNVKLSHNENLGLNLYINLCCHCHCHCHFNCQYKHGSIKNYVVERRRLANCSHINTDLTDIYLINEHVYTNSIRYTNLLFINLKITAFTCYKILILSI